MIESTPALTFTLDTRHVFTPYEKANLNDVMPQLNAHGISQNDVWIVSGWSNLQNSMTISTEDTKVAEKLDGLAVYLTHPVLGEQSFTIEKRVEFLRDESVVRGEITIIFKNCCYGELLDVPDERFDVAMKKMLGIRLMYNTYKEYRFDKSLTGNRFCVIEQCDILRLSTKFDRFAVTNPASSKTYSIKVDFKGKVNVCRNCKDVHSHYCCQRNSYFQLKNFKEDLIRQNAIKIHFFSDSQLRFVEHVGLSANFMCSSGAKIGQIVNIIRDNPIDSFDTLIILMGANNIDETKPETLFRTQTIVEVRRLLKCLKQKTYNRVILIPGLRNTEMQHSATQKYQMALLQEILVNETLEEKSISIYYPKNENIKFDAESEVHPSREGTCDFLLSLSQDMELDLFLDKQFAVTFPKKNIYTGVNSMYKYGCRFCEKTYFVKYGVCDDCTNVERFENATPKEF